MTSWLPNHSGPPDDNAAKRRETRRRDSRGESDPELLDGEATWKNYLDSAEEVGTADELGDLVADWVATGSAGKLLDDAGWHTRDRGRPGALPPPSQ